MSDHNEDPKTVVSLSDGPVRNPDLVLFRKEKENRRDYWRLLAHTLSRKNLMAPDRLVSLSVSGHPPIRESPREYNRALLSEG
jgi:hypothetical protein